MRIERICIVFGQSLSWRRKWSTRGDALQYCSDDCRRRGLTSGDRRIEEIILRLLVDPDRGGSVTPDDVARALHDDEHQQVHRDRVQMAARRLHRAGRIRITAQRRPADLKRPRGRVRYFVHHDGALQL
jgi:hypothetical protein